METWTKPGLALSREVRAETWADRLQVSSLPDAGAAASRRARVPQAAASLRQPSGCRRTQCSRDARG